MLSETNSGYDNINTVVQQLQTELKISLELETSFQQLKEMIIGLLEMEMVFQDEETNCVNFQIGKFAINLSLNTDEIRIENSESSFYLSTDDQNRGLVLTIYDLIKQVLSGEIYIFQLKFSKYAINFDNLSIRDSKSNLVTHKTKAGTTSLIDALLLKTNDIKSSKLPYRKFAGGAIMLVNNTIDETVLHNSLPFVITIHLGENINISENQIVLCSKQYSPYVSMEAVQVYLTLVLIIVTKLVNILGELEADQLDEKYSKYQQSYSNHLALFHIHDQKVHFSTNDKIISEILLSLSYLSMLVFRTGLIPLNLNMVQQLPTKLSAFSFELPIKAPKIQVFQENSTEILSFEDYIQILLNLIYDRLEGYRITIQHPDLN